MSDAAAWVSAGAAVVSVGAAIWATAKGARAHKASLAVQAKLAEIEEARENDRLMDQRKAVLRVELVKETSREGTSYRLRIENKGQGEGRNVNVTIDGKPVLDHGAVPKGFPEIRQVGPGSFFQYVLEISRRFHPPFEVVITWDDDSGTPGHYKTTLSF